MTPTIPPDLPDCVFVTPDRIVGDGLTAAIMMSVLGLAAWFTIRMTSNRRHYYRYAISFGLGMYIMWGFLNR